MNQTIEITCPSCSAVRTTEYCGQCGLRNPKKINLRLLLSKVSETLFDVDSSVYKTIVDLAIRPGIACRTYVEGARNRYLNPIKFSFFTLTALLFISNFKEVMLFDFSSYYDNAENIELVKEASIWFQNGFLYFFYLSCLIYAWVTRLFFIKDKFTTLEYYVFYLYVSGFTTVVHLLTVALGIYLEVWVQLFLFVFAFAYFFWALVTFVGPFSWKGFTKSLAVTIVGTLLSMGVTTFMMGVYQGFNEAHQQSHETKLDTAPESGQ